MFKRLLLALTLASIPLQALAATSLVNPSTSQLSEPQSGDTGLGSGTGSSTGESSTLQPVGTAPLQSATTDSTGLTAPNSSYLQEPASDTSGQLQVLLGDNADGTEQALPTSSPNYWTWIIYVLLAAIVAVAITWFVQSRKRQSRLVLAETATPAEADLPDIGDSDRSAETAQTPADAAPTETPEGQPDGDAKAAPVETPEVVPEVPSSSKAKKIKKSRHRHRK